MYPISLLKNEPLRWYKKHTCFPFAKDLLKWRARGRFSKRWLSDYSNANKMTLSNGKIRILDQLTFALGTKYEVVGLSVCKSRQKLRTEATDTQNDNFSTPLPMWLLVTISLPPPPCQWENSDKILLKIQVPKTIKGQFKNHNDTRNYDKSAKFLK